MDILIFILPCIFLSLYIFRQRYQPYALEALKGEIVRFSDSSTFIGIGLFLIRVTPFYLFLPFDGWIDDLQFYVLFNNISVISGQWMIMKGCVQWNSVYG